MIHVVIWLIIFAIYYFYHVYKASVEEKEAEEELFFQELMNGEHKEEDDMKERKCLDERTITGLVLTTLRKIGCDPETEVRNNLNYAYFIFQGEKYTIESNDTCKFITIYDTWWHSISIYGDVEEIGVHSRRTILFIKEIPEIDNYLICVLNDFFKAQRLVLTELEKCKVTEV